MTTLTDSHIFVGNSSNVATDVAMSGDATIDDTGKVTVSIALNNLTDVIVDSTNMFLGSGDGGALTTGTQNTGLGLNVMTSLTSGGQNVAFGNYALQKLTTGVQNIGIGNTACNAITTGQQNVAIGHEALDNATTTSANVAIGLEAAISLVTGDNNVAVGSIADIGNGKSNSVAVGAGASAASSTSVAIGSNSGVGAGISNAMALGYQASVSASNTVQIGNSSVTAVYFGSSGTTLGTDLALAGNPTTTTQSSSDNSTNIATTAFVQSVVGAITAGLDARPSCRVATTAALTATYSNGSSGVGATLTNSGTQAAISIDGVTLSSGNRVLVKNQATAAQNGIYTVTTVGSGSTNWVLTRATDFNTASGTGVVEGAFTVIEEGTSNAGTLWIETGAGPFTIGTTAITFTQLQITSVSDAAITFTDITTGNVSTTKHGFAPKAPNDATKYLDGTGGYSVPAGATNAQTFTSSGTWTKPSSGTVAYIRCWGGGGGGGTSNGGGGGGGYSEKWISLSSLGSTETVTVGAGGAVATVGGNTTFGSWLTGYGGGKSDSSGVGGGGGGMTAAGVGGSSGGTGGAPNGGANGKNSFTGGGGGGSTSVGGDALYGGGGGASVGNFNGGTSVYGGGGGGGSGGGLGGTSVYAGAGGPHGSAGTAPSGGGGSTSAGAAGQCIVYVF